MIYIRFLLRRPRHKQRITYIPRQRIQQIPTIPVLHYSNQHKNAAFTSNQRSKNIVEKTGLTRLRNRHKLLIRLAIIPLTEFMPLSSPIPQLKLIMRVERVHIEEIRAPVLAHCRISVPAVPVYEGRFDIAPIALQGK